MQKVVTFIFLLAVISYSFSVRDHESNKINWLGFQEAAKKMEIKELPVIIDVYTDWCGWCKVMDRKTYGKSKVAAYINEKFYAIKFNAESKEDIMWRGKIYRYDKQRGIHSLALELIKKDMGFPNTVFIPDEKSEPQSMAGYLTPKEFQVYLTYYGEAKNKSLDFESYARRFKPSW